MILTLAVSLFFTYFTYLSFFTNYSTLLLASYIIMLYQNNRLCLIVMIFVNFRGGNYWFFRHSKWNGNF